MKKKSKLSIFLGRIIPIIVISTIVGVLCFFIGKKIGLNTDTSKTNTSIEDVKVETQTISKTLTASGSIESSSSEKLELNTSYYYDSIYVEEDDIVKKGDKILKYTNGKYLYAPYDLIVTKLNVPSNEDIEVNNNYIEVCSNNILNVNIKVDESKLDSISIGKSAKVFIKALNNKEVDGIITNISNSASKGKFNVTIELENTNDIKIGMSVNVTI